MQEGYSQVPLRGLKKFPLMKNISGVGWFRSVQSGWNLYFGNTYFMIKGVFNKPDLSLLCFLKKFYFKVVLSDKFFSH